MILITRLSRKDWLAMELSGRHWWGYSEAGPGWATLGFLGLEVTVTW